MKEVMKPQQKAAVAIFLPRKYQGNAKIAKKRGFRKGAGALWHLWKAGTSRTNPKGQEDYRTAGAAPLFVRATKVGSREGQGTDQRGGQGSESSVCSPSSSPSKWQ